MRRGLLTLAWLLASACQPNTFYAEVTGETTVQGSLPGQPLTSFPTLSNFTDVDFDSHEEFKAEGVTKAEVRSVKLERATLLVQSPPEQGLGFLDSAQLFVRSADRETLVAEQVGITELPLGSPALLEFVPLDVELRSHAAAPTMSIIIRAVGRQPSQDTRLSAKVRLRVELGAF